MGPSNSGEATARDPRRARHPKAAHFRPRPRSGTRARLPKTAHSRPRARGYGPGRAHLPKNLCNYHGAIFRVRAKKRCIFAPGREATVMDPGRARLPPRRPKKKKFVNYLGGHRNLAKNGAKGSISAFPAAHGARAWARGGGRESPPPIYPTMLTKEFTPRGFALWHSSSLFPFTQIASHFAF
jgi:hypothetical protein